MKMANEKGNGIKGSVLITGASGGFGILFAQQLEQLGYTLLLHGRDKARLQLTLDTLKIPSKHRMLSSGLAARKEVDELIDQMLLEDDLVGLVNNAGFGVWGAFEMCESVPQLDVLRVDLIAPVMLTHALLPGLKRKHGFIINVSSLAGESPLPYMSTYAAAKAGLSFWSEALRAELQGMVTVVTLAPGPSSTGFRDVSGAPKGKGRLFSTSAEIVVSSAIKSLLQGGGYCIPGWRHKALWCLQKLMPRLLALPIMARYLKP
ncbi:MAG: SDR family NAD(P)-dependent oxidoreductase [Mariprofundaceae bacterium]|nr:SDR family NAD(P)-dependent oxidoreductase [Mariprofundaceae bacterium]